jgi:hypothetical protein
MVAEKWIGDLQLYAPLYKEKVRPEVDKSNSEKFPSIDHDFDENIHETGQQQASMMDYSSYSSVTSNSTKSGRGFSILMEEDDEEEECAAEGKILGAKESEMINASFSSISTVSHEERTRAFTAVSTPPPNQKPRQTATPETMNLKDFPRLSGGNPGQTGSK